MSSRLHRAGASFEYPDDHINKWADEEDIRLHGYWFWNRLDEYHRVERLDTVARIVYIQPPYHRGGYANGIRYYGLNLFCKIDRAGEWYQRNRTI